MEVMDDIFEKHFIYYSDTNDSSETINVKPLSTKAFKATNNAIIQRKTCKGVADGHNTTEM